MSCPFYWYDNHYACRKSGKDVNEDVYSKYCRNYNYDDCPIYKAEDSSSNCFLTSACVEVKGLADDCHELTTLRNFRDNYLKHLPDGISEIAEYYFVAPQIVSAIKSKSEALSIFNSIYENLVLPCVAMIEKGDNEAAHSLYSNTVKQLKSQYLA